MLHSAGPAWTQLSLPLWKTHTHTGPPLTAGLGNWGSFVPEQEVCYTSFSARAIQVFLKKKKANFLPYTLGLPSLGCLVIYNCTMGWCLPPHAAGVGKRASLQSVLWHTTHPVLSRVLSPPQITPSIKSQPWHTYTHTRTCPFSNWQFRHLYSIKEINGPWYNKTPQVDISCGGRSWNVMVIVFEKTDCQFPGERRNSKQATAGDILKIDLLFMIW